MSHESSSEDDDKMEEGEHKEEDADDDSGLDPEDDFLAHFREHVEPTDDFQTLLEALKMFMAARTADHNTPKQTVELFARFYFFGIFPYLP
jgi:hypothetical protein